MAGVNVSHHEWLITGNADGHRECANCGIYLYLLDSCTFKSATRLFSVDGGKTMLRKRPTCPPEAPNA